MNPRIPIFTLICLFFCSSLSAQECKGFFPFEPDTKFEMTYFDKKGKVTSISQTTITDITETDGVVEAEVNAVILDKKGEEVSNADYRIECQDDRYEINIENMVNPGLMKAADGMELEVSGDALVFPNDLEVGKQLEDASTDIQVKSSGMKLMTLSFDIKNRKVEAKESVTTDAGTFDCYKISYELNTKAMMVKKKLKVTQWISEGVGIVKEETRNRKGKVESSSELTKFSKG